VLKSFYTLKNKNPTKNMEGKEETIPVEGGEENAENGQIS